MKICTIAGAAAEIHAADLGSVVIDKSYHDLVDAVQKYLEKTIYKNNILTSKQNRPLAARILNQKTGGFFASRYFSFCNHHHVAVSTFYADDFGCPYTVATAGANILDAVAVGVVPCRLVGVVTCTFAAWDVSAFDAVHIDIFPPLFQNEFAQCVSRFGDAPSDTRVIADFQVAGLGGLLKFFVVVCAAPATILYAVLDVP